MSSKAHHIRELRQPVTGTVSSFDATRIHFDLYDAPSKSLILVIPGFWRDRRHEAMRRFASRLVEDGYRTAVCDLRGHGDSEGKFGFNLHEHYDVAAVAEQLLERTSAEAITFVGFSYGGAIAISATARHELPVRSLLLISPVAELSMVAPRINPFTIHRHIALGNALRRPRFDWRFVRAPKISALEDVASVHAPISFVHVKHDWLISHDHSVALYGRANEPKELHVIDIPGCYHADRIFNVAPEAIDPIIDAFLERHSY